MQPETRLKKAITDAFEAVGLEVIRIQCGRVRVRGGWMHGAKEGTPDLLVPIDGRAVFFEVKLPGEHATTEQLVRHDELRRHGCLVYITFSPIDALQIVRKIRSSHSRA